MHDSGGVHQVERPQSLLATHPGEQLSGARVLKRERAQAAMPIELQHPRDHELAQPAVRVVEEPGPLRRVAA